MSAHLVEVTKTGEHAYAVTLYAASDRATFEGIDALRDALAALDATRGALIANGGEASERVSVHAVAVEGGPRGFDTLVETGGR